MNSKLEGLFSAFSSKLLGDEKLYTFVTDKAELDYELKSLLPPAALTHARDAAQMLADCGLDADGIAGAIRRRLGR